MRSRGIPSRQPALGLPEGRDDIGSGRRAEAMIQLFGKFFGHGIVDFLECADDVTHATEEELSHEAMELIA